jgi:hypothetical protein
MVEPYAPAVRKQQAPHPPICTAGAFFVSTNGPAMGEAEAAVTAVVRAANHYGVEFKIESISNDGACLAGPLCLLAGERIQILFELDAGLVDLSAEVTHVDPHDGSIYRVAVVFRDVSLSSRYLIARLVAR